MRMRAYAHTSYEDMYARGTEAGMGDVAADYFAHFEEVELILDVDVRTGEVRYIDVPVHVLKL